MADLEDELSRYHVASFAWALACCRGDRMVAEDVLQTAYLKVLDGRARFDQRFEFRPFLFGVIRHTAKEERRRNLVRTALSLFRSDADQLSVSPLGLESLLRSERTRELHREFARLSIRQREVLHLVFYQDLTIADAAVTLGISVGSARTHYERGKAHLRSLLSQGKSDDK